jgi:hypothetical protein
MIISEAKVLSILKLQPHGMTNGSSAEIADVWRMCLSYPRPNTVFQVELREPLKSIASEKYSIGMNGLVEFDLFSAPPAAAGDRIQIELYNCGASKPIPLDRP